MFFFGSYNMSIFLLFHLGYSAENSFCLSIDYAWIKFLLFPGLLCVWALIDMTLILVVLSFLTEYSPIHFYVNPLMPKFGTIGYFTLVYWTFGWYYTDITSGLLIALYLLLIPSLRSCRFAGNCIYNLLFGFSNSDPKFYLSFLIIFLVLKLTQTLNYRFKFEK